MEMENNVQILVKELRDAVQDVIKSSPLFGEDFYLLRWLVARNMDVKRAEKMLRNAAKWRKENNIDALAYEQFPSKMNALPIFVDAISYDGDVVASIHAGKIDLRANVEQFGKEGTVRLLTQALVQAERVVLQCNKEKMGQLPLAEDSMQGGLVLVNFDEFNPWQINSVKALQVVMESCKILVNYFPGLVSNIIHVNCGAGSSIALKILRSMIEGPHLKIDVYGHDDSEWKPLILSKVSGKTLRKYFGGEKDDEENRKGGYLVDKECFRHILPDINSLTVAS